MSFQEEKVAAWVDLCEREGDLRRNGAPQEEIAQATLAVICKLVELVSPSMSETESAALLLSLLQTQAVPEVEVEVREEDPL